ncbi:DUF6036 family nucleotidyltransferase [Ruminococcus sp. HUN007]|uniref:DUF6036 family nucleotidyltransferase n=1 Tax=Ruminococcus sp. HUN007 TaxID=1514668 RepID=UPI0005D14182|nr:DUF6036 family nucleotidyltransferase [Ruminococcus sp. HUN007]
MFEKPFTKENLDQYLKELAKEFRKLNGKTIPADIVLIGGASVVINYGFRNMTYDMDAVINASASMKDAINHVGDKYNLPNGWLNTDFMKTTSYSTKIVQYAKYYRTFSNIVTFRTIAGEYLLAMKLMAGRQYKYDLSDVIGILWEHEKSSTSISLDQIKKAAADLYGSYDKLPEYSRLFIEKIIAEKEYEKIYEKVRNMESENKDILLDFQDEYPGVTNTDNINDIIAAVRKKKESENLIK